MFAWLFGFFRRKTDPIAAPEDFLPGERARTKNTGITAQQVAWRRVSTKMSNRNLAEKPNQTSEFSRLLRK